MNWFQSIDRAAFRWINQTLSNPAFDALMPRFVWDKWFVLLLAIAALGLIWKGGRRGRLCVIMLVGLVILTDTWVCNTIKHTAARPRPFHADLQALVLVGRGDSGSLPSSHAANWFAGLVIAFCYYRRSIWFMLPLAILVAFSRVYNGVHYPSDVIAGALIGGGCAAAGLWGFNSLWQWLGRRWFPQWWHQLPSLLDPNARSPQSADRGGEPSAIEGRQWLRLGYVVTGLVLFGRLVYLATTPIQLSEDEAYQWIWSKHLALSYFSKPPFIAYTQFLGTWLWGDTEFGIRFFSPVISAVLSLLLLRFLARETNERAGCWLVLAATTTPLLATGSILMTVDPLAVLFWTAAMVSGWRAIQNYSVSGWLWTGLWMGFGFLSKYTTPLQLLCWAVFFGVWKPARPQLRRPGPYLALLVTALCTLPVLVWNSQHGWITVAHVAGHGGIGKSWWPSLRYVGDFLGVEALLLNPVYFVGALGASILFWKQSAHKPLLVFLFSMGAPVFVFYLLLSFHSRVFPNWIAPAVLPLFCLAAIHFEERRRAGSPHLQRWFITGLGLGLVAVILAHNTDLIGKISGRSLPPKYDPLRRVRSWTDTARAVQEARRQLLAAGKPVFIIGDHYGITSLLTFYLPEAKAAVANDPLVYFQHSDRPANQFFFWPGYQHRRGDNAIYVLTTDALRPAPASLRREFGSVKDLGLREIVYHNRIFHRIQLFECRDLR